MTTTTDESTTKQRREAVLTGLGEVEVEYRRLAETAETWRQSRNRLVQEAINLGATYQDVAQVTGLNKSRIGQLVRSGR